MSRWREGRVLAPALDPSPWTARPCPAPLAAKPPGWPPLQALVEWGCPALRMGLPWAQGTEGWPSGWEPWGHLRAFVLGSQLQTIMSRQYLLTVHDFEQEGSEARSRLCVCRASFLMTFVMGGVPHAGSRK